MKTLTAVGLLVFAAVLPMAAFAESSELDRTRFSVTLPLRNFFNCSMLPAQCQKPVPEGKRFVVENVGAYLRISTSSGTGNIRGGFHVDLPGLRSYFPFTPQATSTSEANWAGAFQFRSYVDAGENVSCSLTGFSVSGSPSFSGDCVLSGYLIDKPSM